jgi:pimeloyl-ACP methyl ester carboxylesterase
VAPIDATVFALASLLRSDGHGEDAGGSTEDYGATFVGHSLGSTCVAWMLHDPRARSLVRAAILLDPVTFLLMDPGIAYNFLHRPPVSVLEVGGNRGK